MASAAEWSGNAGQLERSTRGDGGQDRSRLLPVLAAERLLRAVLLVGVGLILPTHAHADWADLARRLIGQLGLDSSRNEIGRLISGLAGLGPRQYSGTGRLPSGTERWRPWRATGCCVVDGGARI
jgi:hypothetical protein